MNHHAPAFHIHLLPIGDLLPEHRLCMYVCMYVHMYTCIYVLETLLFVWRTLIQIHCVISKPAFFGGHIISCRRLGLLEYCMHMYLYNVRVRVRVRVLYIHTTLP